MREYNSLTDKNFIYSTWLKGLRFGNEWFLAIDSDSYFKNYQKVIEKILTKPNVHIPVACFKDDPEVILSYAVIEGADILHYVFTKPAWRKMGLTSSLITRPIKTVTHLTKIGRATMPIDVQFDPFII